MKILFLYLEMSCFIRCVTGNKIKIWYCQQNFRKKPFALFFVSMHTWTQNSAAYRKKILFQFFYFEISHLIQCVTCC